MIRLTVLLWNANVNSKTASPSRLDIYSRLTYLCRQTTPQQTISRQAARPQNPTPTTNAADRVHRAQRSLLWHFAAAFRYVDNEVTNDIQHAAILSRTFARLLILLTLSLVLNQYQGRWIIFLLWTKLSNRLFSTTNGHTFLFTYIHIAIEILQLR